MTTINDKKDKNTSEKDVKSLYEIGTKVMGFRNVLGSGHIIAGSISLVVKSTTSPQANLYQIEGIDKELSRFLDEEEILPFDQEIFDKALKAWKEYVESYARCHELYQDVMIYFMKNKYRKRSI